MNRQSFIQGRVINTVRRLGKVGDLALASFNIFSIIGSPVHIYSLFGVVTTGLGATAVVCRLQYTCSVVTGAALTPLCDTHATMISDPAGTIYYWSGLVAGHLIDNGAVAGTSKEGYLDLTTSPWSGNFITLLPGVICVTNTVPGTGVIDWYISYLPLLDEGVIAAL